MAKWIYWHSIQMFILFFFGCAFSAMPGFSQDLDTDSLKQALSLAKTDADRLEILDYLAGTLPDGEWQEYNEKLLALAAVKLSSANGTLRDAYLKYQASGFNNKSIDLKYRGQTQEAIDFGEKALYIFETLRDSTNLANAYYNNGRLYNSMGNIYKAISLLYKSLVIYDKLKSYELQTYNLNMIGNIYKDQGELDKAIEMHTKALAIGERINHKQSIGFSYACLGQVYFDQKDYTRAYQYFSDQLKIFTDLHIDQDIAAATLNLSTVLKQQGDYTMANEKFKTSISIYDKIGDKLGKTKAILGLGDIAFINKQYPNAERYYEAALALADQMKHPKYMQLAADGLYNIYKQRHQNDRALAMLELSTKMSDSLENIATHKAAIKSQYKYEFEKKAAEDSIKQNLRSEIEKNELRVLQADLSKVVTQRYLLITGLSLFITIAFFIYYRLKQNQRFEELEFRNKMASDLHDDIGSALSSVLFFSNSSHDDSSADAIEKIRNTTQEAITNMSDIVWSIEPRNDSMHILLERMKLFGRNLMGTLDIKFHFEVDVSLADISLNMLQRKNIYLIYKEALNNAAKHSGATVLKTTMVRSKSKIKLTIEDDGTGFDPSTNYEGNGLLTMRQRASDMGAEFSIVSSATGGTSILLQLSI